MKNDYPFIKLFKTIDCFYMFDVNTASIIRINEDVYNYLEDILKGTAVYNKELQKQIDSLKSRGFLKPNDPNIEVSHPALSFVEESLDGNIGQLILQVTQNCNLRCKYCVYSGSYVNRTHSNKRMSFETAKKAIDFYYKHNRNKEDAVIGFYGGEPLLEMDLIKRVVEYSQKLFEGKSITFNLTTNATLLTEDIIRFLNDNGIGITISLNGPKAIHDNGRVFADNSTGTFESVMKNLDRVCKVCPEYLKNISFNAVLDTKNDFKCSSDFFSYEFMKDALVTATTLNSTSNKEKISYTEQFDVNYRYEIFKYYLSLIGKYKGDKISKIVKQQVGSLKTDVHDKLTTPYLRSKVCHPSGPCIPGALRLFVNADGNFYPCERVSETCAVFQIGNLGNGFDIEKSKTLLNIGSLTKEQCKNCWAVYFCSGCASGLEDGDHLSAKKRLERCDGIREGCITRFQEYCMLRENGYKFEGV